MAVSEALIIAFPAAVGITLAAPKEYSPKISFILATLGAGSGILGIYMARKGQLEAALVADTASILFGLLSVAKALEVV